MTLIDGDRIITTQEYDDEYEEFIDRRMSIIDYINMYTHEGVTEADVVEPEEWIPVSERLPNLDDYTGSQMWQKKVLITGYLSFDDTKDLFVSEAFAEDVIHNSILNTVVMAWKPLPKPYKGKSEE